MHDDAPFQPREPSSRDVHLAGSRARSTRTGATPCSSSSSSSRAPSPRRSDDTVMARFTHSLIHSFLVRDVRHSDARRGSTTTRAMASA